MKNNKNWLFVSVLLISVLLSLNFVLADWENDTSIISGLPADDGSYTAPDVFFMDGYWYLIYGNDTGDFGGYVWNDTDWILNSTITNGLDSLLGYSIPEVFYLDNGWYLIGGQSAPATINGSSWNGTGWEKNTSIVSGLIPYVAESITTFQLNNTGVTYLIFANYSDDKKPIGYYWNNTDWVINSSIIQGIEDINIGDTEAYLEEYTKNGVDYLIYGSYQNGLNSSYWNDTDWVNDLTILTGYENLDDSPNPTIFNMSVDYNMIVGTNSGYFYGYKLNGTIEDDINPDIYITYPTAGQTLSKSSYAIIPINAIFYANDTNLNVCWYNLSGADLIEDTNISFYNDNSTSFSFNIHEPYDNYLFTVCCNDTKENKNCSDLNFIVENNEFSYGSPNGAGYTIISEGNKTEETLNNTNTTAPTEIAKISQKIINNWIMALAIAGVVIFIVIVLALGGMP